MKVFLIGFMGSGKTTLGKKLANKLDYEFIDMDNFIEEKHAMTIPQIFAEKGEPWFRDCETEALRDLQSKDNAIIATGGGAPCFNNNMQIINNSGTSIYIKVKAEVLLSRLRQAKDERPLLKDKTDEEMLEFIKTTVGKREEHYSKARHVIEGINLRVEDLLFAIENELV